MLNFVKNIFSSNNINEYDNKFSSEIKKPVFFTDSIEPKLKKMKLNSTSDQDIYQAMKKMDVSSSSSTNPFHNNNNKKLKRKLGISKNIYATPMINKCIERGPTKRSKIIIETPDHTPYEKRFNNNNSNNTFFTFNNTTKENYNFNNPKSNYNRLNDIANKRNKSIYNNYKKKLEIKKANFRKRQINNKFGGITTDNNNHKVMKPEVPTFKKNKY